jgi:hypothetical protein
MSEPKFKFGDIVYWVESSCNYCAKIPCPMCFGKLKVEIILGNGDREFIECGFCSHGYKGASGAADNWEPMSKIKSGPIVGIRNQSGGWAYDASIQSNLNENELFTSEAEAEPLQKIKLAEEISRKELWYRDNFIQAKKNQVWSAAYHRRSINDLLRSIEWHKMRLCLLKEMSK